MSADADCGALNLIRSIDFADFQSSFLAIIEFLPVSCSLSLIYLKNKKIYNTRVNSDKKNRIRDKYRNNIIEKI